LSTATGAAVPRLHDAAKLLAWREESGLSREQVCAAVQATGLPLSAVWLRMLETGTNTRQPSLPLLFALAAVYGHAPGELLLDTAA
jgi:transcriptional regulator with XRE-family HTH domain